MSLSLFTWIQVRHCIILLCFLYLFMASLSIMACLAFSFGLYSLIMFFLSLFCFFLWWLLLFFDFLMNLSPFMFFTLLSIQTLISLNIILLYALYHIQLLQNTSYFLERWSIFRFNFYKSSQQTRQTLSILLANLTQIRLSILPYLISFLISTHRLWLQQTKLNHRNSQTPHISLIKILFLSSLLMRYHLWCNICLL